ncbi:MAG: hypothetical protein VXZ72_05030, partial [Chlamydiota bacterium]|nr:hypothetical protein [Chlamydiota bacterium]
ERAGYTILKNREHQSDYRSCSINSLSPSSHQTTRLPNSSNEYFSTYKLQYHPGSEIATLLKQSSPSFKADDPTICEFFDAIKSLQWVESTNSLLYSGSKKGREQLTQLLRSLDVPKKQVFIEVLVVETDVKNGRDFGLEWGAHGIINDQIKCSMGNQNGKVNEWKNIGQEMIKGSGASLGVMGDLILHQGKTFLTLSSLVSALEQDKNTSITLNQKILAQDNKTSSIFVGERLPFNASAVRTTGSNTVQTSNIEYKDVGVKLDITPLLGPSGDITLTIAQQISDVDQQIEFADLRVNGIQTTKSDIAMPVHVHNRSFLLLSGMTKNKKIRAKSGIPCLGGLPLIGAAFNKESTSEQKRQLLMFIHPQIVNSEEDHIAITDANPFCTYNSSPQSPIKREA